MSFFGRLEASVINARSVAQADVRAAVASAKDGDTVAVPAGTANWPTTLTIAKAITLQGSGVGETVIVDDLPKNGNNLVFSTNSDKFYRLTGFEFRPGDRAAVFRKGCVVVNGSSKTVRIDHCKFNRVRNRSIYFRNAVCGLVDHCVFVAEKKAGAITIFHDAWDGKSWGDGSWAAPIDWGGSNAIYIEDNDFSGNGADFYGVLDEYAGARFVFRHNEVRNGVIASHGTGSTGRNRGVRHWEIYSNTMVFDPPASKNAIHMRGGTGVVYNNTLIGITKFLTLHTYRYHTGFPKWPGSDGTCSWDKNDPKLYVSGTAGMGSGIGPSGAGGTLVVPQTEWATNQWVGYTVKNLDGLSNTQPSASKGGGPGPFFSSIVSNTSDTLVAEPGSQQPNKIFAPGDRFEIRKVIQGLDMIGASTGDLLSGNAPTPRWLNQKIEPTYVWNNSLNGVANAGVAIAPDPAIKEGVHFFNNKLKPDYKPLVYPHPLVRKDSTILSKTAK